MDDSHKICYHCTHENSADSVFCENCGRKLTSQKKDFRTLVDEFLNTTFSLDKGFLPTFRDQWIPGRLTSAYFDPSTLQYTKPIKFFFISAILTFALLSIFDSYIANPDTSGDHLSNRVTENRQILTYQQSQDILLIDSLRKELLKETNDTDERKAINIYFKNIIKNPRIWVADDIQDTLGNDKDSIGFNIEMDSLAFSGLDFESGGFVVNMDDDTTINTDFKISFRDFFELKSDTLFEKYDVNSFWSKTFLAQFSNMIWSPNTIFELFQEYLTWFLIANVPIAALVFSLLYVRRRRYYIEHIVFNLFTLATSLYITLFTNILGSIINNTLIYIIGFVFIIPLFYFLSMLYYYKQGFWKTTIKFILFTIATLLTAGVLIGIYSIVVLLLV